jgi:hypothetical protein
MPELMYFYIVRSHLEGEAWVIREFVDEPTEKQSRPSGTLFEIRKEMDIGDLGAWERINQTLAKRAQDLGIHTLHNLNPPDDMAKIVQNSIEMRTQTQTTE